MPVRTKRELEKAAALLETLRSLSDAEKDDLDFSVAEVAAMTGEDPKQIHRARERVENEEILRAREKLEKGEHIGQQRTHIKDTDLESIQFVKKGLKYKYPARAVEKYLDDCKKAADATALKIQSMKRGGIYGFQSWLTEAMPLDQWPFSIQPDGRPMDMCAAIALEKLTGEAESLNIREFTERIADMASRSFHDTQAVAIEEATLKPEPAMRRSGQRIDD